MKLDVLNQLLARHRYGRLLVLEDRGYEPVFGPALYGGGIDEADKDEVLEEVAGEVVRVS